MSVVAEELVQGPRDHVVAFYDRDDDLVEAVSRYVVEATVADEVAIVIARDPHCSALADAMAGAGTDVAQARATGRLLVLDAAATMAQFVVDGHPNRAMFDAAVGGLVREASSTGRPVRAYGEMVALLWEAGQVNAAIELEGLWNDLRADLEFSLLCAYPRAAVDDDSVLDGFNDVCGLHSCVVDIPRGWDLAPGNIGAANLTVARKFNPDPTSPSLARRFVAETLTGRGRAEFVPDASIVVTELATNAVVHARSPFTVTVAAEHDQITIAVRDRSSALPAQRIPTTTASSGRGLHLVAGLAKRWGADPVPGGKTVWAEIGG